MRVTTNLSGKDKTLLDISSYKSSSKRNTSTELSFIEDRMKKVNKDDSIHDLSSDMSSVLNISNISAIDEDKSLDFCNDINPRIRVMEQAQDSSTALCTVITIYRTDGDVTPVDFCISSRIRCRCCRTMTVATLIPSHR